MHATQRNAEYRMTVALAPPVLCWLCIYTGLDRETVKSADRYENKGALSCGSCVLHRLQPLGTRLSSPTLSLHPKPYTVPPNPTHQSLTPERLKPTLKP